MNYLYEASDFNRMLNDADTLEKLRIGLNELEGYADDAIEICKSMNNGDFKLFRSGLKKERSGKYAGDAWGKKFGNILIPSDFLIAGLVCDKYKVPLGTALIRLKEAAQCQR